MVDHMVGYAALLRQRLADREALAKGMITREELAQQNGITYGRAFKVDLKSGRRLW